MNALRKRFVLVAVGVLVPVALLVWRALHSVEVERRERHRVVAERVFDEMERALSEVVASVDAHPFDAWPTEAEPADRDRPYLVAYFEERADGSLRAPSTMPELLRRDLAQRRERLVEADAPLAQAPGTTREAGEPARNDDAREEKSGPVSAYDAIRSLNKGVEQRLARGKRSADAPTALPAAPAMAGAGEAPAPVKMLRIPSPLVGQAIDGAHVVLVRTSFRDGQSQRQGVVVDVPALARWLTQQGIGDGELRDSATMDIGLATSATMPAGDFRYTHRFADPFGSLSARLALRTLPGSGGAGFVYALSALLVVATVGGLFAVDRMVSVALAFAQRRSDFVAAVSHELKTPLTSIRMYGEMLRDGIVPSEEKRDEYHRHITAESERLSRLINNVLEFARIEKGTRTTSTTVGSLAGVIEEATQLLRPHTERAGFVLQVDVEPDLPPVRFERDATLQVLFNLVDNAVKYASEARDRTIVLRARRDGDHVVLGVRDHGPGVPIEQLGRIFEPFYRGERELTRRNKGTGLGLALVTGLAEAMGATVRARNADGGGLDVAVAFTTAG